MNERQFQELRKRLEPYVKRIATSGGSVFNSNQTVIVNDTALIDYLKRDGTRSLLGNLAVADGKTIDGVDVSVLGANYTAHLTADSHVMYAHANGLGVRPAYAAENLNRYVNAGTGLMGGGLLFGDVTLTVKLQAVSGLVANAGGLAVSIGNALAFAGNVITHDTGDFGDLHENYSEHAQNETITGDWTFEQNTLFQAGLVSDAGITGE